MERTVIDWVEELRGLDTLEAAETILSGLGRTRRHDVACLRAYSVGRACQRRRKARAMKVAQGLLRNEGLGISGLRCLCPVVLSKSRTYSMALRTVPRRGRLMQRLRMTDIARRPR